MASARQSKSGYEATKGIEKKQANERTTSAITRRNARRRAEEETRTVSGGSSLRWNRSRIATTSRDRRRLDESNQEDNAKVKDDIVKRDDRPTVDEPDSNRQKTEKDRDEGGERKDSVSDRTSSSSKPSSGMSGRESTASRKDEKLPSSSRDTRDDYSRGSRFKEPPAAGPAALEERAAKATDDPGQPPERGERRGSRETKEAKGATAADRTKESPRWKERSVRQGDEKKGAEKKKAVIPDERFDEDNYSTGSEDYCEETKEEIIEPGTDEWCPIGGGVVTRRTTRTTTTKRKYGKPSGRRSSDRTSSEQKPTTSGDRKRREEKRTGEDKAKETNKGEVEGLRLSTKDSNDKTDMDTCPCCGSCWPSHTADSRVKQVQGQSRTWRRQFRLDDENPVGDEWYEVRNFGPRQNWRSFQRRADGALRDIMAPADGMLPPSAPSPAALSAYAAHLPSFVPYTMGRGQETSFSAYQPIFPGVYQLHFPSPSQTLFPTPVAFQQPLMVPPAGPCCAAAHTPSMTTFPVTPNYYCPGCRAQAYSGHYSSPAPRSQLAPTVSMEDFLRREQRVRQEERLHQEERQLREERLRREERLLQEERLRREERARNEERRRREVELERARQEERLRIEQRMREEERLAAEARLEEQKKERLERQRRERLDEQRRYNDRLRQALAEQRMADRGALYGGMAAPSSVLDEVLFKGRLRPTAAGTAYVGRVASQDAIRNLDLREFRLRDSERRPPARRLSTDRLRRSENVVGRTSRWEDVNRYT